MVGRMDVGVLRNKLASCRFTLSRVEAQQQRCFHLSGMRSFVAFFATSCLCRDPIKPFERDRFAGCGERHYVALLCGARYAS